MKAGPQDLEQIRLVVLDREQKVATGLEDYLGQGPLREQGIAREYLDKWVMFQQLRQASPECLGFGGLAVGYGKLGQAEAQVVCKDVEHVNGIAVGVMALFTGLAIDCDDAIIRDARQVAKPERKSFAELFQREFGDHATDRGGVWRFLPREAQRSLEGPPVVPGPTLQAGEIGLTAEKSEKGEA